MAIMVNGINRKYFITSSLIVRLLNRNQCSANLLQDLKQAFKGYTHYNLDLPISCNITFAANNKT